MYHTQQLQSRLIYSEKRTINRLTAQVSRLNDLSPDKQTCTQEAGRAVRSSVGLSFDRVGSGRVGSGK